MIIVARLDKNADARNNTAKFHMKLCELITMNKAFIGDNVCMVEFPDRVGDMDKMKHLFTYQSRMVDKSSEVDRQAETVFRAFVDSGFSASDYGYGFTKNTFEEFYIPFDTFEGGMYGKDVKRKTIDEVFE